MSAKPPNKPSEWFDSAKLIVSDEGVFSEDQISHLRGMVNNIEQGVSIAIRDAIRKAHY